MGKIRNIVIFVLAALLLASCEADKINTSPDVRLGFSTDKVLFDTVFTNRGNATRRFKIYNPTKNKLVIKSARLRTGGSYSINFDGRKGDTFTDITMEAKDSIVVYVQVFIDPSDKSAPFLVRDSIEFMTNGNEQKVYLEAYGQNAKYFKVHEFAADTTITSFLPILVQDSLKVPEGVTLTLTDGAELYFCKDAVLEVGGTLKIEGSLETQVLLRGDRSDYMNTNPPLCYDRASGQWGGIAFTKTSLNNTISYGCIRNATFGLRMDSLEVSANALLIENSKIYNSSGNVISTVNADVTVRNSLLYNAGGSVLDVTGGKLDVRHCTIANYYSYTWGKRSAASINLRNETSYGTLLPLDAVFYNNIVYGTYNNEVTFVKKEGSDDNISYKFYNCLLKQLQSNIDDHYENCMVNLKPQFVFEGWSEEKRKQFPHQYDFHIMGNSPAIGKADYNISLTIPYDLDGNSRTSDGSSDIGCYEFK